jgi:hypothetical protein
MGGRRNGRCVRHGRIGGAEGEGKGGVCYEVIVKEKNYKRSTIHY